MSDRLGSGFRRKEPVPIRFSGRRSGKVAPGIEPASVSGLHRRVALVDDRHPDDADARASGRFQ